MSEYNLIEHFRNVSNYLICQYRLSSTYKNTTGKGDIREDVLIDCLKETLPDSIGITKGEVIDSNGIRSPEFDIVIYLRNSGTCRLYSTPNRKVIPIEEVLAVIEVKSFLKEKHITTFLSSIEKMGNLNRFYNETQTYQIIKKITGDTSNIFSTPIPANQGSRGIGRILGFIFAYESSDIATVKDYLNNIEAKDSMVQILVLNKALWVPDIESNSWCQFTGEDSFILFINSLLRMCENDQRWSQVVPNYQKYFEQAASATDLVKKSKKS